MTGWPDPYPMLLEQLWQRFRGADAGAPPPLPDPPADAARRPVDDLFWANAFTGFLARYFNWHYITTDDVARGASVATSRPAPQPATTAASPAAASPASDAPASNAPAPIVDPGTPDAPASDSYDPDSPLATSSSDALALPLPPVEQLPANDALTAVAGALDQVPRDIRREQWQSLNDMVRKFAAQPDPPLGEQLMRPALEYAEWLGRYSAVVPALETSARALLDALQSIPGVTQEGTESEIERASTTAVPGTRTRILRLGYAREGRPVIKPKHEVSARQLSDARNEFEQFVVLANAVEELAPRIDAQACYFLRRAPELIDSHAQGDPTSPTAVKLLRDCIGFASDFTYFHSLPEYASLQSGFERVIDVIATILREHNMRVFPSISQPFRQGRPAPAPFPQTVLKEIPDTAPEGTLLRVRKRGLLHEGRIEEEPVVFISRGPDRDGALAKALTRMALELRRMQVPHKKWTNLVERSDKLLLDWVDADDDAGQSQALRFLINHLDELVPDGPLRDAADALVDHLRDRYGLRAGHVRAGSKADTVNPNDYDFQQQPGSGQPSETILHVRKRCFRDSNSLLVQRGLLVTA